MSRPWNKLIVALDLTSQSQIREAIRVLSPKVKLFKIGLIAYTRFGPKIIKTVTKDGAKVFLDFKLYDIPNTMVETAKAFVDLGVWAFTVHLKAGEEAISLLKREIKKAARRKKKRAPLVIGVTELTSKKSSIDKVLKLAKLAKRAGVDGVVCSVWEAKKIKQKFGLVTITPGIRPKKTSDDQKRVATVTDALKNKVDYFVVGRPIVAKENYLAAAGEVLNG